MNHRHDEMSPYENDRDGEYERSFDIDRREAEREHKLDEREREGRDR